MQVMTNIKNPWGDGRDCAVISPACEARSCLHIAENKGTFVQGLGYTHYYKNPKLVCWTNHIHGCPYPLPEPDPERVRCCPVPDFSTPNPKRPPHKQKCRTCGQWASGIILDLRRSLPVLEHSKCRHTDVSKRYDSLFEDNLWYCQGCLLYWKGPFRPEPFTLGGCTYGDLLDEKYGNVSTLNEALKAES